MKLNMASNLIGKDNDVGLNIRIIWLQNIRVSITDLTERLIAVARLF